MSQYQKQPNRVSFSFGMKLSLPTKYESADFHVSLGSDVNPGETPEQALDRVKCEVESYVAKTYEQIRNSEEGLTSGQAEKFIQEASSEPQDKEDGKKAILAGPPQSASEATPDARPRDTKALRQQIKFAFGVLEAQKKVTKSDFVKNFLNGKKTDDLNELEVTKVIVLLRDKHPELGL